MKSYLRMQFRTLPPIVQDDSFLWDVDHELILQLFPSEGRPDSLGYIGSGAWIAQYIDHSRMDSTLTFFAKMAKSDPPVLQFGVSRTPTAECPIGNMQEVKFDIVQLDTKNIVYMRPNAIPLSLRVIRKALKLWISQEIVDSNTLLGYSDVLECGQAEGSCPICYESYVTSDEIRKLKPCKHFYHKHCVDQWLNARRPDETVCPTCMDDVLPVTAGFTDIIPAGDD